MNRIFVNYANGCRGDFLASCLTKSPKASIVNNLNTLIKIPPLVRHNIKIHGKLEYGLIHHIKNYPTYFNSWDELFSFINQENYLKIKIVANTVEEIADAAWLACIKVFLMDNEHKERVKFDEIIPLTKENVFDNLELLLTRMGHIYKTQNLDYGYEHEYDHIINFYNLFDVEFIENLYEQINQEKMGIVRGRTILKNINLQPKISETEFYPIIKEKYHELFPRTT